MYVLCRNAFYLHSSAMEFGSACLDTCVFVHFVDTAERTRRERKNSERVWEHGP